MLKFERFTVYLQSQFEPRISIFNNRCLTKVINVTALLLRFSRIIL
jgi:hypothetical protein